MPEEELNTEERNRLVGIFDERNIDKLDKEFLAWLKESEKQGIEFGKYDAGKRRALMLWLDEVAETGLSDMKKGEELDLIIGAACGMGFVLGYEYAHGGNTLEGG